MTRIHPYLTAILGIALAFGADVATAEPPVFSPEALDYFESHVRPVLAETCYECHGPEKQEAGLRLDSRAAVLNGADSGPVVVPGDPDASRLVHAIRYTGEIKMPEDMKLFDHEIEALTEWVRLGIPWPAETPGTPTPAVDAASGARDLWALEPVRDPRPPSTVRDDWVRTDVDRFVAARLETAGLTPSPPADPRTLIRRVYFDLIGLPPAPREVETFVNDPSPAAYEKLVDSLLDSPRYGERWARHWLDLARYSDTKGYVFQQDPFFPYSFTYRDYVIRAFNEDLPYNDFIVQQLAADHLELGDDKRPLAALGFLTLGRRFLEQTDDIIDDRIDVVSRTFLGLTVSCARCHDHKYDPIPSADYYALYGVFRSSIEPDELPLIEKPDESAPLYQEFLQILDEKHGELEQSIEEQHIALLADARDRLHEYLLAAHDAAGFEEEALLRLAKERELNQKILKNWMDFLEKPRESHDPVLAPWFAFAALDHDAFPDQAAQLAQRFAANGDESARINPRVAEIFNGEPPESLAEVAERYGALFARVNRAWQELLAARAQAAADANLQSIDLPASLPDSSDEEIRQLLYGPESPANIPRSEVEDYSETRVREHIRRFRRAVERHEATHAGRPLRAMALYDRDTPYEPYVFLRGKSSNRGDPVDRRFLSALCNGDPEPFEHGSGRLELARAITSESNPLTARVLINRVWMHHFGEPLVSTPSDFGSRSDPPSHPDLLDYLARRFMDGGWSIKDLHRLIVSSNAYQQTSAHRAGAYAVDPENRLLWRQNRRRLDFEALRDSMLTVSGTLDAAMYGPPVDLFEEPFTGRRSVYGLVVRQNAPGTFRTFDVSSPDAHSPRRHETVVPQQALFLMNSPFVVTQARALVRRPELAVAADDTERVRRMVELVHQRTPDSREVRAMIEFLRRDFDKGPEPPPPSAWNYGFGSVDPDTGVVSAYTPFTTFREGRWQPAAEYPDDEYRYVAITKRGGHPGRSDAVTAIRRWTAPHAGTIQIAGRLRHPEDQGEGILSYVVQNGSGLLGTWIVHNASEDTEIEDIDVDSGDSIDFAVAPGDTDGYDSFAWTPRIVYTDIPAEVPPGRIEWEAREDFRGPPPAPPEPLQPWEQLAQVLLCSNEFMYVD